MFRSTPPCNIFIHQLGVGSVAKFHSWKPTNTNMNKLIMKLKERSKINNYYGYYLQRHPDRELMYAHLGGPRAGQYYVRQSKSARQFEHFTFREGRVGIHYHTKFGKQHQTLTNSYVEAWTGQLAFASPHSFFVYNHFSHTHVGDRESTTKVLESWGLKTVHIDSRTAPRVGDLMAHRHKLYGHNFPWIRDPITNAQIGDADWGWKESDQFDYEATRSKDHATFNHSVVASIESAVNQARGGISNAAAAASAGSASAPAASSTSRPAAPAAPAAAAAAAATTTKKAAAATEEKAAAAAAADEDDEPAKKSGKKKDK